ncbi:transcriptional regulator with XRE-family HTH domain [Sphingomonas sp. UYAg733]
MHQPVSTLPAIGRRLRRFRALRGIKQAHVADLLGVTQAMVSRWESGLHRPAPDLSRRIETLIAARADGSADAALRRLVLESAAPVHLICDATHVLLAASRSREAEWRVAAADYVGASLWRFATPEIVAAEQGLDDAGWFDRPDPVRVPTSGNGRRDIRILPSILGWERIALADGRMGRLVTTVAFT